ncbi:hypothetical protein JEQ12_018540 [Ovis aries]|uniref:Tetratricopeptide repeat protein 8 n=1 Tax=Ovis aries TaxID=9940 RepID=A0A836A1G8_SHEEP|nr:hypothetical protein JEQ12_018540 [Ovis aries]
MEPLLLAWSYFRRRRFQLCADLCTQMLEKSPCDQVPAGPRRDCGSWQEGSGGSPGPHREGAAGRRTQGEGDPVVSTDAWSPDPPGPRPLGPDCGDRALR